MTDERLSRTYGNNYPLHRQAAAWDGHRSVRLAEDDIGLATTAYSYKLSYEELTEAAERIALLWNLHLDTSTEELRRLSPPPQTNVAPEIDGGRFEEWSLADFAAQCRMQSREQLDPEFSRFMAALAKRLSALATEGKS